MSVIVMSCGRTGTNIALEILRGAPSLVASKEIENKTFFTNPRKYPHNYLTKTDITYLKKYQDLKNVMAMDDDLKIIWAIRDPRDILISKIKRGQPILKGGDNEALSTDATPNGAIASITRMHKIYDKAIKDFGDKILLVRMEDMILKTKITAMTMADFLGIDYDEKMINFPSRMRNKQKIKRYGNKIDKSQVQLWTKWTTVYNGFFKNTYDLTALFVKIKHITKYFGYTPKQIGLFLVGAKGLRVLENLIRSNVDIVFAHTYSDRKVNDNTYQEIYDMCANNNIPMEINYEVDKIFVIGWQFLLKENLQKLIILHDSDLPNKKGWAPTISTLIDGDNKLAATAFEPTEIMDEGPIFLKKSVPIKYPMNISRAIEIVADLYSDMILEMCNNNFAQKQYSDNKSSFSLWRDELDYYIDWENSSQEIKRFVDAVGSPYDGAASILRHTMERIIVTDVEIVEDVTIIDRKTHIGKIIRINEGKPIVVCGDGLLQLNNITIRKIRSRFLSKEACLIWENS